MMATHRGSSSGRVHTVKKGFKLPKDSPVTTEEHREELREGLWGALPQNILVKILIRLPVVTQCRLRCVCSGWKDLLSAASSRAQHSGPPCTIICIRERISLSSGYEECNEDTSFFCPKERKWFRLSLEETTRGFMSFLGFKLVATDGGLLCYQDTDSENPQLLVCNPITGCCQGLSLARYKSYSMVLTKFVVNLNSKTYKVFITDELTVLAIFDSGTREWKDFSFSDSTFPWPIVTGHGFVWKNVIFERAEESPRSYLAFDMQSGLWSAMEDIDLPCDTEKCYHLGSWKDQVVLVQLHAVHEDPVGIWLLRDNPTDAPSLSAATWEKVSVKIPNAMKNVVGKLRGCLLHGHEYVCFTTDLAHQWVTYTFKTKTWQLMPRCAKPKPMSVDSDIEIDWFNFEPQFDMSVSGHIDSWYAADIDFVSVGTNGSDKFDDSDGSGDSDDSNDSEH